MFSFKKNKIFQNDKELSKTELAFLIELTDKLSFIYPGFKKQVHDSVIQAIAADPMSGNGSYIFTLDSNKWEKLSDKLAPNFQIQGIFANDNEGKKTSITIYTHEGLMIGFFCAKALEKINLLSINISSIYEKHFLNPDAEEIIEIINLLKPYANKLDLSTSFKLKFDSEYYTVKDLGNGNYLVINKNGEVFELQHDPINVNKIHSNIDEFIQSLKQ